MTLPTVLDAFTDPTLFGQHFPGATWRPWHALLATLTGQVAGLPPDLQSLAAACTGREDLVTAGTFSEVWAICGRRSGKSRVAAAIATWIACSRDWRAVMAPGETATVALIAENRPQARIAFRYIRALIRQTPLLAQMIAAETAERLELTNGAALEVFVASGVRIRGYSIACAILDEIAFWPTGDFADPDHEVLAALRPALANVPGSRLIAISSPYSRRGELWNAYAASHGQLGAAKLVWRAASRTMNATISPETVADALAADPQRAGSEWLAEFRTDCERLFTREAVEGAVVVGRRELPKRSGVRYVAFVDPAGGSGADAMTLCVAHAEDGRAVIDAIRARTPRFDPNAVTGEFAGLLRSYGLVTVTGDRYGGDWPATQFREHGIRYEVSARTASQIFLEALPLFNAERVELLDDQRTVAELVALERRVSRGGRDLISHAPNGHDDHAVAACGAAGLALARPAASKVNYAAGVILADSHEAASLWWPGLTESYE